MAGRDPTAAIVGFFSGLALLTGHVVISIVAGPGYAIPTTIVGAAAAAIILRGPLGQALAARLHGSSQGAELPPEQVLNELDELRGRITELEERADFSERLLSQHREREGSEP
jgi:hypothetical protein